jgi:hypothetical protein
VDQRRRNDQERNDEVPHGLNPTLQVTTVR